MSFRCDQAVETDEPFFRRLLVATLTEELAAWAWPEAIRDHLLDVQYRIRREGIRASCANAEILRASVDEEPVGWVVAVWADSELHIVDIAVLPERRGQGIGTAILSGLLEEADRKNLPVRLAVNIGNPAARLYERLGFTRAGGTDVQHYMLRAPARELKDAAGRYPEER